MGSAFPIVVLLFIIQICLSTSGINSISIFRNDEVMYHKYSAALAAAEPFRLQLEHDIQKSLNPISKLFRRMKLSMPITVLRHQNTDIDTACHQYEKRMDEIVRSYGLNIDKFNELSLKIEKEPVLKERVLLQAYYYRIAADLERNIQDHLPILPSVHSGLTKPSTETSKLTESQLTRFCKTLKQIENERQKQRDALQHMLGLKSLPVKMRDPDVFPAMTKEIQQACLDFEAKAADIISKHGISTQEFNSMHNKLRYPGLFRFRVDRELSRLNISKDRNSAEL